LKETVDSIDRLDFFSLKEYAGNNVAKNMYWMDDIIILVNPTALWLAGWRF